MKHARASAERLRRPVARSAGSANRLMRGFLGATVVVAAVGLGWCFWQRGGRSGAAPTPSEPGANGAAASGQATTTVGRPGVEQGKALLDRGNDWLREGRLEEALASYQEAQRLNPEDEDVYYNLGIVLSRLGRTDDAIAAYRRALELFPKYAEAHNNLGNLLLHQGKVEEAVAQFEAAIEAVPEHAAAHNNLGNALVQQGRIGEASLHFLKATQIDPNYWQARFNLANSYLTQQRVSQAITEYQEVLRQQPSYAPAQQALSRALEQSSARPR